MTAIIFGSSGQDGHYLQAICRLKNIAAIGVSRSGRGGQRGDISSYDDVKRLFMKYRPTLIFHLAAHSTTRHNAVFDNHAAIATGTINILEAAKELCPDAKIFIAGSGLQFVNTGIPISETDNFDAQNPYAVARIHSVYAARYYRSLGLRTYIGYLFHHESPYRKPEHVSKIIASAVKRIAEGSNETIELGDISVEKEWTFAGDVARGIFTLLEQDEIFECTIGSGKGFSIADWLDHCFKSVGLDWHHYVRSKNDFHAEYKRLVSDPKTISSLGWLPVVSIAELADQMVQSA